MPLISACIACAKILAYIVSSISRNHSYGAWTRRFAQFLLVHYFLIDGFLTTVVVVVVVVVISLESLC